jgi:hypothetical protein
MLAFIIGLVLMVPIVYFYDRYHKYFEIFMLLLGIACAVIGSVLVCYALGSAVLTHIITPLIASW